MKLARIAGVASVLAWLMVGSGCSDDASSPGSGVPVKHDAAADGVADGASGSAGSQGGSAGTGDGGASGGSAGASGGAAGAAGGEAGAAGAGGEGGAAGAAGTCQAGAAGAGGWGVLDLHQAVLHDNPADEADWPVTTTITKLDFTNDGVHVEFSKQDGEGRWPDITPPGWTGPLQYTMGMAEYINGQWHASAAIQFWYGLSSSGGNVALDQQVAKNWYYDTRWGEMQGYQPCTGEMIGIFVVAGNVRGVTDGSQSPVQERSNVVLVPMPGVDGATHTF